MKRAAAAAAALAILLASCGSPAVVKVDRDLLFTLGMGKLEDQLSLFQQQGPDGELKTRFCMRDGFFYIANGEGKKVLEFTSYGDLLSMIYDPEANPESVTLRSDESVVESLRKRASQYPFVSAGEIAVNSAKEIFVEDRLPEERRVFDDKEGVLLDRVVLRFRRDGSYNDYIGQEGIGGTPFPYIEGVYSTANDELVVVSREASAKRDAWLVHWFGPQGNLISDLAIPSDRLPMPKTDEKLIAELEGIVPDPESRRLYLFIDYSKEIVDPSTRTSSGIAFYATRLVALDPASGARIGDVEVPASEQVDAGGREIARTYSFLGASRGGKAYFMLPRLDGPYDVMVLDVASGAVKKASIAVAGDETRFSSFFVSQEGILCGLLATETEVRVVWWKLGDLAGDFLR